MSLEKSKPVVTGGTPDLTIFVPSRGRPDVMNAFGTEFLANSLGHTTVVFVLDEDDPLLSRYMSKNALNLSFWVAKKSERGMNGALNQAFQHFYRNGLLGQAIGFMGDDHRPRTPGWDLQYMAALDLMGTGFVYGDDLFQRQNLPTQVAFTTDIGAALGYMSPPELQHLNIDNVWLDWGNAIGRIQYLPNVVVEHLHPLAGKGRMDKGYRAVNNPVIAKRDGAAYNQYHVSGRFAEDVGKLRMLVEYGWTEEWDSP